MTTRCFWFFLIVCIAMVFSGSAVEAQQVNVSIAVIKASNSGNGIDENIKHLQPKLSRLNYASYTLLKQDAQRGELHTELIFDLPDGDTMRIKPIGIESGYLKLFVAMDKAGLKTNFKIANGNTIIVGGSAYQDGSMVIALSADY
ncbi:hypothetical protein KDK77_03705 [bacterium]|nr:hypothetical protein [bacterium]